MCKETYIKLWSNSSFLYPSLIKLWSYCEANFDTIITHASDDDYTSSNDQITHHQSLHVLYFTTISDDFKK